MIAVTSIPQESVPRLFVIFSSSRRQAWRKILGRGLSKRIRKTYQLHPHPAIFGIHSFAADPLRTALPFQVIPFS